VAGPFKLLQYLNLDKPFFKIVFFTAETPIRATEQECPKWNDGNCYASKIGEETPSPWQVCK